MIQSNTLITNDYHFFWHGPFSQWDLVDFEVGYEQYNSAEQFMMATKAKIFKDYDILRDIMTCADPREQKALGRQIKNFDVDKWNAVAKEVVYDGNYAKFTQSEKHFQALIATDGRKLVEASPYDAIWGIKMSTSDPNILDQNKWKGTNWLGDILTELKADLFIVGF